MLPSVEVQLPPAPLGPDIVKYVRAGNSDGSSVRTASMTDNP